MTSSTRARRSLAVVSVLALLATAAACGEALQGPVEPQVTPPEYLAPAVEPVPVQPPPLDEPVVPADGVLVPILPPPEVWVPPPSEVLGDDVGVVVWSGVNPHAPRPPPPPALPRE